MPPKSSSKKKRNKGNKGKGNGSLPKNDKNAERKIEDVVDGVCNGLKSPTTTAANMGRENSIRLIDGGVIPMVFGFLKQCRDKKIQEVLPNDTKYVNDPNVWIALLNNICIGDYPRKDELDTYRLQIAEGIDEVVACMSNQDERKLFKSKKHWHSSLHSFFALFLVLGRNNATIKIMLKQEKWIEMIAQSLWWREERPDIFEEAKRLNNQEIGKFLQLPFITCALMELIVNVICQAESDDIADGELYCLNQNQKSQLKAIAQIPIVSHSYDPNCSVSFMVGLIRLAKSQPGKSDEREKTLYIVSRLVMGDVSIF